MLLTHPHSLHLRPEGVQQLKQDQTQRVNVHFVGVRVSRELPGGTEECGEMYKPSILKLCIQFRENRAAHLLRAHVEFGADLTRVAGQERGRRQGGGPIIVLLLVHGRHQTEVSDLNHVVHGEEDVGGLSDRLHMFNGHRHPEQNPLPVTLTIPRGQLHWNGFTCTLIFAE